jgi:hypothetical protein
MTVFNGMHAVAGGNALGDSSMMYPNESVIAPLTGSLISREIRFPVSYCGVRLIASA